MREILSEKGHLKMTVVTAVIYLRVQKFSTRSIKHAIVKAKLKNNIYLCTLYWIILKRNGIEYDHVGHRLEPLLILGDKYIYASWDCSLRETNPRRKNWLVLSQKWKSFPWRKFLVGKRSGSESSTSFGFLSTSVSFLLKSYCDVTNTLVLDLRWFNHLIVLIISFHCATPAEQRAGINTKFVLCRYRRIWKLCWTLQPSGRVEESGRDPLLPRTNPLPPGCPLLWQ